MKKAIVVYESKYGNTKRVAEAIIEGMKQAGEIDCKLVATGEIHTDELAKYDAALFGCPNHGQIPSRGMTTFIDRASTVDLSDKVGAAFDTYMGGNKGVAVKKLERKIREKLPGLSLIVEGHSAEVAGRQGPLLEGEIPKAIEFGKAVGQKIIG